MTKLKTTLTLGEVENLGIYEAATLDGYWNDRALADLQLIYLKGQLRATQSIHSCTGNNATRLRLKTLNRLIAEAEDGTK